MKASEILVAAVTVLIVIAAGFWLLRRAWKGLRAVRKDDEPILWI